QYIPRKRSSKHLDELREINEEREETINPVPPFTPAIIKSWSKFNAHLKIYKQKHHLKFRVRSSETRNQYNRYV
ncbi:hypothetical protein PHYSODRAFT_508246, partial [Phytophthora sojae]